MLDPMIRDTLEHMDRRRRAVGKAGGKHLAVGMIAVRGDESRRTIVLTDSGSTGKLTVLRVELALAKPAPQHPPGGVESPQQVVSGAAQHLVTFSKCLVTRTAGIVVLLRCIKCARR